MAVKRLVAYSLLALVVAFAIALAVVVGNRMSAQAMAVVIGVVCGVAASIPMSVIILALSRRSRPVIEEDSGQRSRPPVVVVTQASSAQPTAGWADYGHPYAPPAMPAPREFRVIGDDSSWGER